MRRYPFANLCEALHVTPANLKRRLGLDHRQLSRYLEQGLPEARADELAGRLGLVTVNVWPEMIDHAIEDTSVECASCTCSATFIPVRSTHRYCSSRCRERERMRAKYHADPEFVAAALERRRNYYADYGHYERAEAKRRYWEDPERHREARRQRHKRQVVKDGQEFTGKNVQKQQVSDRSKIMEITGPTLIQCPETGLIYELRPDSSQVACGSVAA